MIDCTWKYVKQLKKDDYVAAFLAKYDINLPQDLIRIIKQYNGGRPSKDVLAVKSGREFIFNKLLSYNECDHDYIGDYYPNLFEGNNLFPFGLTPSGDFICYDMKLKENVVWDHELNKASEIVNWK